MLKILRFQKNAYIRNTKKNKSKASGIQIEVVSITEIIE